MPKGFRKDGTKLGFQKGVILPAIKRMYERFKIERLNAGNPNWSGSKVGYIALHNWIRRRIKKPELCNRCKKSQPYDLANKGIYNRELKNWEWLCRRCHMLLDGRMKNLKRYSKGSRFYLKYFKDAKCKWKNCKRSPLAKWLCNKHYQKWRTAPL